MTYFEQASIIQRTTRNFSNLRTLNFLSLKLDILSLESLYWVLKSLRRDEMLPSEKAIISRIKEAFAYRVQPEVWAELMRKLRNQKPQTLRIPNLDR